MGVVNNRPLNSDSSVGACCFFLFKESELLIELSVSNFGLKSEEIREEMDVQTAH